MGWIYKITNNINNKIYIGQTTQSIEKRFRQHISEAKNGDLGHLHGAMRKYGFENFSIIGLQEADNSELNGLEKEYIASLKCTDECIGYNMDDGGRNGWNTHPDRHRYTRKVNKFDLQGNFLETYSSIKECAEANNTYPSIISNCLGGTYKSWNNYQYKYDGEAPLTKITKRGSRPVNQLTKAGEYITTYPSLSSAAKAVGIKNQDHISKCCNGINKTSGGFKWEWAD